MKHFIIFVFIFSLALLYSCANNSENNTNSSSNQYTPNIAQGETTFNTICSTCHGFTDADGKTGAPLLSAINARWPNANELHQFIKNAPEACQKTEYGKQLFSKYKDNLQMPPYIGMSTSEIDDVIAYIKSK